MRFLVACVALSTAFLAACSNDDEDITGPFCIDVSPRLRDTIASGARDVPIAPIQAYAIESPSVADAFLVVVQFNAPPENRTNIHAGVWLVDNVNDGGQIRSVDSIAQGVTDWPHALDAADPGVAEVKKCLPWFEIR